MIEIELIARQAKQLVETQDELDAARWRYFAQSAQTALMLGSELDPHSKHDWLTECNKLADGLMTPNFVL